MVLTYSDQLTQLFPRKGPTKTRHYPVTGHYTPFESVDDAFNRSDAVFWEALSKGQILAIRALKPSCKPLSYVGRT